MKRLISFSWQWLLAIAFGVSLISRSRNAAVGKRVHVFGSGPSAEQTRFWVREGDFCLACNHAVKWRSSWDVVFVETVDNSGYGLEQIRLLQQVNYGLLICKNNYPYHPLRSISKMRALRKFVRLSLLPEYQASPEEVTRDLENAMTQVDFVFPQYASSILTMVLFAVRSGTREIWLHGVDAMSRKVEESEMNNSHATERLAIPFSVVFEKALMQLEASSVLIKIAQEVE